MYLIWSISLLLFKLTPSSTCLGWFMAVNVVVGVISDEISEDLVRIVWEVAQRIFKKYGLEVYVVPVTVNSRFPYISINGVRVAIKSPPSPAELEDLILSVAMYSEDSDDGAELLASLEDPEVADAVFVY
ncbi:MAG: hypothetical protein QXR49_02140 [Sulfolobales archaeon]